jgi:hypothetical protein
MEDFRCQASDFPRSKGFRALASDFSNLKTFAAEIINRNDKSRSGIRFERYAWLSCLPESKVGLDKLKKDDEEGLVAFVSTVKERMQLHLGGSGS